MGSFQWKVVEYKEQNGFVIVNFFPRDRVQRRRYRIEHGVKPGNGQYLAFGPESLAKSVAFKRNRATGSHRSVAEDCARKSFGYVVVAPWK